MVQSRKTAILAGFVFRQLVLWWKSGRKSFKKIIGLQIRAQTQSYAFFDGVLARKIKKRRTSVFRKILSFLRLSAFATGVAISRLRTDRIL